MYKAKKEDIERTKRIIKEELEKNKRIIVENELDRITVEILNTAYSIGGGYDEITIRKLLQSLINKGYY